MSPRIGMGLSVAPWAERHERTCIGRVRQAIRRVQAQGIWVVQATGGRGNDYGVEATGQGWETRVRRPFGVTPAGAILLAHQPDPEAHEGVHTAAAADAIQAREIWVIGLEDGWRGEVMSSYRALAADGEFYRQGFEAGIVLRWEMQTVCEACGARRWNIEPDCTGCHERPRPQP